jgi:type I restriction enzyme S subunit
LGDIVDYGRTQKAEPYEIPNEAWLLELEDVEKETAKLLRRVKVADRQPKSTKNQFSTGDVLYGKLRPNLNKVVIADQDGFCTTEIVPLKPTSAVLGRYLWYGLRRPEFVTYAIAASHGLNMPRLGRQAGIDAPFNLAPLGEQRRIVEKLDYLFARIQKLRVQLDSVPPLLDKFKQLVLDLATSGRLTEEWRHAQGIESEYRLFDESESEIFGTYEIPSSWNVVDLGTIASVDTGITKDARKQLPEYVELPYLRVANVQRGYFDLSEIKTIRIPEPKLPEMLLRPGDILFNEGGDRDKLGRGWVWAGEVDPCTFQNHVFRVRLNDSEFQGRFFSWFGNTRGVSFFLYHGKQSTNLASINKSVLASLPVPVPPVAEQREIVERIHVLFAFADRAKARRDATMQQLEALPAALLEKAFSGQLVPQDSADDPASALLERLRHERAELAMQPKSRTPRRPKQKPKYMKNLEEALLAAGDWISGDEAFRLCGVSDGTDTQRFEELYAELRALDKSGRLETRAVRDAEGRKRHDLLRLKRGG